MIDGGESKRTAGEAESEPVLGEKLRHVSSACQIASFASASELVSERNPHAINSDGWTEEFCRILASGRLMGGEIRRRLTGAC